MALCDHRVAGALIEGADGYAGDPGTHLMFERVKPPYGVAPPCGHVDEHGSFFEAMCEETREEVNLSVEDWADLVNEEWRGNACRRDHSGPTGHTVMIKKVRARGIPRPAPKETKNLRWYTKEEIRDLTARTILYANGHLSDEEFRLHPGIEPFWVEWLVRAGLVSVRDADLALIAKLARRAPSDDPDPGRQARQGP